MIVCGGVTYRAGFSISGDMLRRFLRRIKTSTLPASLSIEYHTSVQHQHALQSEKEAFGIYWEDFFRTILMN